MFWKVALSGLLDSAFKESKDQTDANKVSEQDTLTRGAVGKVQRKETKITKVERTITNRTKRKFLQKFSRVTTDSSDSGNTSLSKLPSVVDSPSLEMALSPRSKRKVGARLHGRFCRDFCCNGETIFGADGDLLL